MIVFRETISKAAKPRRKLGGPLRGKDKVTKTYARQSALAKQMGNTVRINLVRGISTFKERIDPRAMASAWKRGDYAKARAEIPWDKLPEDIAPVFDDIFGTVDASSEIQLQVLDRNINARLRFDMSNPRLREYVKNRSGVLITRIEDDTREIVSDAVARSFTNALTPDQVAEQIRDSIGLLPAHEQALANYRATLVASGLKPASVDRMAGDYEDRLLDYRARMIARTETRGAVNFGQLSVWDEGANQGYIDRKTAEKELVVDGDPCEFCEPMDGKRVKLGEPFFVETSTGLQAFQAPPFHPHCFCGLELHFGETENESDTGDEEE